MKLLRYVLVLLAIACGIASTGCSSLETDFGSLAGTVFYADGTTRVAGATVRVYDAADTAIVIAETVVDDQARYFFNLHEGDYMIMASPTPGGEFFGTGETVTVVRQQTTKYFFPIAVNPPSAP